MLVNLENKGELIEEITRMERDFAKNGNDRRSAKAASVTLFLSFKRKRAFLWLSTKGGKEQEFTVTVNRVLEEILDAYLQASGLLAHTTLVISHGLSL